MKPHQSVSRVTFVVFLFAAVCAFTSQSARAQAPAGSLWYNGDMDTGNGMSNEKNTQISDARVYDNFTVPDGETWQISGLFSRNQSRMNATGVAYEIRSDVSSGNGGTLLFGDTSASFSQIATGRIPDWDEYTFTISGLNLTLEAGTYWLAVTPIGDGHGGSYISTTSGENAVGNPAGTDGNAYFDSNSYGTNFQPTGDRDNSFRDFSMGVIGTNAAVPDSGTSLLLIGIAVSALFLARRVVLSRAG